MNTTVQGCCHGVLLPPQVEHARTTNSRAALCCCTLLRASPLHHSVSVTPLLSAFYVLN